MLITEQYASALQQQQQQPAQPTFNWTGVGTPVGSRVHYSSFNFAGEPYALGNAVYLLPEEEGAPPYIARLVGAWEDTAAPEPERLVIEVQWFERRCSVPPGLAAVMHEREVAESDLRDTNQVGCIDRKALLVAAPSYSEALAQIPTSRRKGEWHFCRGVLESETQVFRTYAELGQHMAAYDQAGGLMCELGLAAGDAAGSAHPHVAAAAAAAAQHMGNGGLLMDEEDEEMDEPPPAPAARKGGGKGGGGAARNRRGGAAARGSAAGGAGGGGAGRGIPGKICCECGATQTPQWREGPQGPKTLCNACGVRYQRSQSKAKSNKRAAREQQQHGAGGGRAPKAARFNHSSAAAAAADGAAGLSNGASSAAVGDGSTHPHGTRSKAGGAGSRQQQQQRTYVIHRGSQQQQQQQPPPPPPRQPGKGRPPSGSKQQQALLQQLHAQAAAAAAAAAAAGRAEQHHYFEDEGSPPNSNTHILEVDDEETAQPQLKDTLHRSATQDAADVLQTLSTAAHPLPRPQQQQQQLLHHRQRQDLLLQQQSTAAAAAAATAAFCNSSVIGSPATMLLPDQLTADGMPLLSLDDKITPVINRPGSPDGLIGINTNSLSPIQPRNQRGAAAGGGGSGARGMLGVDAAGGGSGGRHGIAPSAAACASPGRLISSMLQGLKMPGPLSLNGTLPMPPLPAVTSALSAADRQQQQLLPGMGGSDAGRFGGQPQPPAAAAAAAAAGGGSAAGAASGSNNPLLSQLQSLVYRASAFTSDLQGLGALYPGPGSPTDLPALVRQLEQLPHCARSDIQRASTDVEDSISRAKAAEAAVLAVTQVLAAKKQAAAEARCEVEKAVLTFRHMLAQFSPSVAAAVAAGSGGGAGGGGAGGAGAGSMASPAGSGGDAGGTAAGSAGGVVGGSSRLGGNSPRVLMPQAQAALSHHAGFEGVDCFGPHPMTHPGGLVMADASVTDDLLRDPYAVDDAAAAGAASGGAAAAADGGSGAAQGAAAAPTDQKQQQPKLEQQQAKLEQHQGPSSPDHYHQQQQDQQKQQQVAAKQEAPQQDQQQSLLKQEAGEQQQQQQQQLALCSGSLLQPEQPAKQEHSAAAAPAAAVAQVSAPPPSAAHTASGTAQVAA